MDVDPFAAMAGVELTGYCTEDCDPDCEGCGPPVLRPISGFDAYMLGLYVEPRTT